MPAGRLQAGHSPGTTRRQHYLDHPRGGYTSPLPRTAPPDAPAPSPCTVRRVAHALRVEGYFVIRLKGFSHVKWPYHSELSRSVCLAEGPRMQIGALAMSRTATRHPANG